MPPTEKKQEKALNALEAAADALQLPQIGEVINDRYRVIENLGKGSSGWVWGVEHLHLKQKFAMKFLLPSIAQNIANLERFREEARITSLLGHENIVFVTEFGTVDPYGPYFVMEYLEGERLADILSSQKKIPLQQILRFALSVSNALSAVAELGIVHCDLKPENIFFSNNTWKILDFGISDAVTDIIKSDTIFGTPKYMAPEQAMGLKLDSRADQFSLAVILYEMITGKTPWKLNTWNDAMPESRARYKVLPPSRISEGPPELDAPIMRALSLQRRERFSTIEDFISAIVEHFEIDIEPQLDPNETTQPRIVISNDLRQSLVVGVEHDDDERPRVSLTFRNADRLRREYRRHLIAGRLFIAADTHLLEGTEVRIEIIFEPRNTYVKLAGVVSNRSEGGFGLKIDPLFRKNLNQFLTKHRLGFGFIQHDILIPLPRKPDTSLTVGEALILTKITDRCRTLSCLRVQCTGLPIDFESCIARLIEKEFAQLSQSGMAASSVALEEASIAENTIANEETEPISFMGEETQRLKVELSPHDVERVLSRSRGFIRRKNYLGAISILESVVDIAPDATLHLALAHLFDAFSNDRDSAKKHLFLAAELDPASSSVTLEDIPFFEEE